MRSLCNRACVAALWPPSRSGDEAALVHWVQDANEPPSWAETHRRLQQEGRCSTVSHPSEARRRFEIREPRTEAGVAFK